jgi:hypothetical protein
MPGRYNLLSKCKFSAFFSLPFVIVVVFFFCTWGGVLKYMTAIRTQKIPEKLKLMGGESISVISKT